MAQIKLCGMSRLCDIEVANALRPEYIGFVFAKKSRRYVSPEEAGKWKEVLSKEIRAVGVFVDEQVEQIAHLYQQGIIDMAQLHGNEDENYIKKLKELCKCPVIKAFTVVSGETEGEFDIEAVEKSSADYVLLDSGAGSGETFAWDLIQHVKRPYFLAGGLGVENVERAISELHPFAVDVSSGIETDKVKDKTKMKVFVDTVRKVQT